MNTTPSPITAVSAVFSAAVPLVHDERTVAYVVDPDTGALVDEAWSVEAAQSYVLSSGMLAIAVAADGGYWSISRQQDLYDAERARFLDCWTS